RPSEPAGLLVRPGAGRVGDRARRVGAPALCRRSRRPLDATRRLRAHSGAPPPPRGMDRSDASDGLARRASPLTRARRSEAQKRKSPGTRPGLSLKSEVWSMTITLRGSSDLLVAISEAGAISGPAISAPAAAGSPAAAAAAAP